MNKATGKMNYNSLSNNDCKMGPLMRHLEYLMELGDEVRATQVVTTLVKGKQARINRDNDDNERYLPMSMGYRNCYKRYLASLGYTNVRSTASGAFILGELEDGEAMDSGDFVTFPTYYYKWKTSFPKLKVSKPIKVICAYCYAFANRHKYLANCAMGRGDDGGDDDEEGDDNVKKQQSVNATDADNGKEEGTADSSLGVDVNLNAPEALWRKSDEERELMLLEAAWHIKMATASVAEWLDRRFK
jgi:hypothetical protein